MTLTEFNMVKRAHIKITLLLLLLIYPLCSFNKNIKNKIWNPILDYESKIAIDEYDTGTLFPLLIKNEEDFIELEKELPDEDDELLINANEFEKMSEFIKEQIAYECPMIKTVLKANFIHEHKFFYIHEFGGPIYNHNRAFMLAIKKNGGYIHRFSHFELEVFKTKFSIKKNDLKFFNKLIKNENMKIEKPSQALDLCMLFIKLATHYSATVISNQKDLKNEKMHLPLYKNLNGCFEVSFFTSYGEFWHFTVSEKGRMELKNHIYI